MREDIVGGLRNALDRGETLEHAIQTFVNAGYNLTEVREAANYATGGTLASLTHVPIKKTTEQKPTIKKLENHLPKQKIKTKSKISWKAFVLVGLLLVLVGVLVSTLIFRESIMDFLKTTMG